MTRNRRLLARAFAAGSAFVVAGCNKEPGPDAFGNVEATEVVVGAQTAGQLKAFEPLEGQHVAAGDVVAVVDTSALVLQLREASSQRATSGARVTETARQLGVLESQRDIAERNYERTKRLVAQQAATSQQLDQAERDYKTLLAQIEAGHAQVRTASEDVASNDARAAQIRDQIRRSRVSNPLRGTVLTTYTKRGEFVQVGQPLYKIANLDTVELRAYVTQPQLAQLKLGKSAEVTFDSADTHQTLPGVVSWISSQAEFTPTPIQTRDERTNLVYAIKLRVPNPNGVLKIGMPVDVRFTAVTASR
ncbi:MAG TPA: HlyD family efflux transporter periplasmic adaptor subunit [Gemmatimonadaceae bacterium]|jgi:HlyD family secretion protein|nr:HlyD family efflux transporter periplasmic adaptor subunit [Gemmatimonadaceae bacterium]